MRRESGAIACDGPVTRDRARQLRIARHDAVKQFAARLGGGDRPREALRRIAQRRVITARAVGEGGAARGGGEFGAPQILDGFEIRRDIGLEREEVQQPLAEPMQGEDFQPARRLDGLREKPARGGEFLRTGFRLARRRHRRAQRLILHHRPAREHFENALRHIGGGGFGESEAEDFRRRRAIQKQAHDALGQHMGLAGARVRADPGGGGGVGGAPLARCRVMDRAAHDASSSAPTDHSSTRARWS